MPAVRVAARGCLVWCRRWSSRPSSHGWGAGSWELPLEQVFATTLRAEGNPGYDFARWSEDGVTLSTDSVYPMQLAGNHKITAHFSVNPERGRWGPGNTYTDYEFPGTGYESLAWTFLPVADPPESLRQKVTPARVALDHQCR